VTDYTAVYLAVGLIFVILLILLFRMIWIIKPCEVGVVTLLGAYKMVIRPGFSMASPLAKVVRVDLRTQHVALPPTTFNLPSGATRISVDISYKVTEPAKAVFQVSDLRGALLEAGRKSIIDFFGDALPGHASPTDFEMSQALSVKLNLDGAIWGVKVESAVVQRAG